MKNKELDYTQLVILDGELVQIMEIGKREIIIATEKGKRRYTNAGSLSRPVVYITVPLEIQIEVDEDEWHVSCPQLRGFHTAGKTFGECLRNALAIFSLSGFLTLP